MAEIAEHCAGAKIVLVALKCDLREEVDEKEDENAEPQPQEKPIVKYDKGLEVAKRIGALRYLGIVTTYFTIFPTWG